MFKVVISAYRLSPRVDVFDAVPVYESGHRSAAAAGRRLAKIISRRTKFAREIERRIPKDYAGRYQITNGDSHYSLTAFREIFVKG